MKNSIEEREQQIERLLTEAAAVAARYRQSNVGAEHLLFVLSGTEEGRRCIEAMNGQPRPIRQYLEDAFDAQARNFPAKATIGATGFDETLQKVIEGPVARSRMNLKPVSFRDILLEMIRLGKGSPMTQEALRNGGLLERDIAARREDYRLEEECDATPLEDLASDEEDIAALEAFLDDRIGDELPAAQQPTTQTTQATPTTSAAPAPGRPGAAAKPETAADPEEEHHKAVMGAIRNLSSLAERGQLDAVIGRDDLIEEVLDVLCRRNKQNVLLHGAPGVGKTAIAEGLALKLTEDETPPALKGRPLLEVSISDLVAGARYRGDFEARMRKLVEIARADRAILFIDEIHMMVGAGAASGRGGMDASNILKPALARGEIALIGATTPGEMRELRQDGALMRRFQPIAVREPSAAETREIIDEAVGGYVLHHEVMLENDMLDAVVDLADRHLPQRRFPDKAFDLIDTSAVLARRRGTDRVEIEDLRLAVHRLGGPRLGPPPRALAERARTLGGKLKARILGQEAAADTLARAVRTSLLGLQAGGTAGSYLFNGPTGVGKSAMAQALADFMELPLIQISLSEFTEQHSVARLIGAPPGYVGFDQEGLLTAAGDAHSEMVLLLDEIDKAHPDVFDILLQLLDHGVIRTADGREVSLRGAHVVMTANFGTGAEATTSFGFGRQADPEAAAQEAIKKGFRKEFLARVQAIVQFATLDEGVLEQIASGELRRVAERLAEAGYRIEIGEGLSEHLARAVREEPFAVRSLQARIKAEISDALADTILDDTEVTAFEIGLENGDVVIDPA